MEPTRLLPLLASLQMLPWPVSPEAPLPAPQLIVEPVQPVYITGETVTLTCSADVSPTESGIRFYRDSQEITSPRGGYTKSLQLWSVSAGEYSCESWETVSGREIKSARSQPRSIRVTARPPAPTLTVSSQHRVFLRGESVTLTCSAPSTDTASGIRFLSGDQRIGSGKFQRSNARSLQLLSVSETNTGEYSCEYWKTESEREIPSERSRSISITVTAPLPAPQLIVEPVQPVYIAGEVVTLTCSADVSPTVSGIRFYRASQEITSPHGGYTKSLQLWSVSAGEYSCESWKTVSGREIKSARSQPRSIGVTAPFSAPQLTVSPQQPVYLATEAVTLICSAASAPVVSGMRFFWYNQLIHSQELPLPQYSDTHFIQLSGEPGFQAGLYSCAFWKTEFGREIPSERSKKILIAVTARPPPPSLSLDPPQPIYVRGERVTLRCSGQVYERAEGYRFFNQRGEQISSGVSSQGTWQISTKDAAASQAYTCLYWRVEHGREIPSEKSPPVPVSVTDPPPQPELSVYLPSGVVNEGISLNITCTAPGDAREWRFYFYKDGVELIPGDLGSEISTMEPGTGSVKRSVLSIPRAGSNITGEFTCGYEENVAGRWILSPRSWMVNVTGNITKSDSQRIRDILLGAGGILLLIAILAALLCYCCRKKRVPKTPKSADESAPREHARNLDPSHDTKGSKAAGAGAEQMKQGSEVTYALLALPSSKPHTTRSKNKSKPVEDEHVLYSEVVTTHNQKKAK